MRGRMLRGKCCYIVRKYCNFQKRPYEASYSYKFTPTQTRNVSINFNVVLNETVLCVPSIDGVGDNALLTTLCLWDVTLNDLRCLKPPRHGRTFTKYGIFLFYPPSHIKESIYGLNTPTVTGNVYNSGIVKNT